ncbi:hypothetical protein [Aureibacter tunicatorum]|uniref:Uncharacterized protein n=1 Tax=Aureibacter tunicatorum TaxID=866807 RepID=A0AAE4BTJ5_9BACT|nr:hypothetical protein [Aureibacter tunicatorum]MDR6240025.1 hypothetical protein [Aureibacter tunicatorum]BDD04497.1 hypothetical protein AUTU_19800 [Aureibacter tunicatorum]
MRSFLLIVAFSFSAIIENVAQVIDFKGLPLETVKTANITIHPSEDEFLLFPVAGKQVFFAHQTLEGYNNAQNVWEVIMFDSLLQIQAKTKLDFDRNMKVVGYDFHKGHFLCLSQKSERKNIAQIISWDSGSNEQVMKNLILPVEISLRYFECVGSKLILSGMFEDSYLVLLFDPKSNKYITLKGFFNNNEKILAIEVDDENEYFDVISTKTDAEEDNSLHVSTFDSQGKLLENYAPIMPEGVFLGNIQKTKSGFHLGEFNSNESISDSEGLYFMNSAGERAVQAYYRFIDFDSFFDYLPAKRREKATAKIEKIKEAGKKNSFSFPYRIAKLWEDDEGLNVLGEKYKVHVVNRYDHRRMTIFGSIGMQSNFSSPQYNYHLERQYEYHSLFYVKFDAQGKSIRECSMPLESFKSHVKGKFSAKAGDYVFFAGEDLIVKNINERFRDPEKLNMSSEGASSKFERIENWDENTVLLYGVVEGEGKKLMNNRDKFFIQLIKNNNY